MNPNIIDKVKKIIDSKFETSSNPLQQQIQNSPGAGILPTNKTYRKKLNSIYSKYKDIFVEKVFTEIALLPEDKLCVMIAEQSYFENRKKTIQDFQLDEKNSSKGHCIYFNPQTKICII
jgi:hypothetical protein